MSRPSSPIKPPILDNEGSSSDEAEIMGSPKRSKSRASLTDDAVLSGSVRSASYNIVFQVATRIFTFLLNAFILRYVSHEVLGICNVRLALLHSTITFLSREPFRRACQRKSEADKWTETINLIWLVVPNTLVWCAVIGYVWCNYLSTPSKEFGSDYSASVWIMCLGLVIDSFAEVPFIIGQYFMFTRLRILGDTLLVAIRSSILCFAVVFVPSKAVLSYAIGNLAAAAVVCAMYYGYFYYLIHVKGVREVPFSSVKEFLPEVNALKVPSDLAKLTWSFFKQGILKQLLTEGERYMMTFFDMLSFEEQGLYDLVSNLGSLAARFIFLPIEESSYLYFSQTLNRKPIFASWDKDASRHCAYVLGNLVRVMVLVGLTAIAYGIPYSNTVLYIYGGEKLSSATIATRLLQANCVYVFVLAVNGITESFTFAAMSQQQLDAFNSRLVILSVVFLLASAVFVYLFGSVGFFVANGLNMTLRILQSVQLVREVFSRCDFDPLQFWKPKKLVVMIFPTALVVTSLLNWILQYSRIIHLSVGLSFFAFHCAILYAHEFDLFYFFVNMFKNKHA